MGLNGTSYVVTGGVVSVLETSQPAGTSSSLAASSSTDPCSFRAKGQCEVTGWGQNTVIPIVVMSTCGVAEIHSKALHIMALKTC